MKPRLVFLLPSPFPLTTLNQTKFCNDIEDDISKIKTFIQKKKTEIIDLQIIRVGQQDEQKIITNKAICQIGGCFKTEIPEMFPIRSHIVDNNLEYEGFIFDKNVFWRYSQLNRDLVCQIVEQSLFKIQNNCHKNTIFVISQEYLNKEWPYCQSVFDLLKASLAFTSPVYSPIAIDLKLKTITNL